jgi:DNA (cytosine-5)-methyltransferase 1
VTAVFGGSVVAYAETDKAAIAALERTYPGVPNAGDITAANWAALAAFELGRVDIVCGGFPCQPVSSAGKRLGAGDERWLWPDVARAVRELAPAWVVLENVDDLVVRAGGALIAEVTAGLRDAGYAGSWVCVKASDLGAAHERDRVFIVARRAASAGPVPGAGGWTAPFAVTGGGGWSAGAGDLFDDAPPVRRWPRSGAWDTGAAWARPLWAARTGAPSRRGTLFPSPAASTPNDGESLGSWEARRDRLAALGYNGNGMGTPLAIAVQRLGPRSLPTPTARDGKGPGRPVGRVRPDGRVRGAEDMTLPDVAEAAGTGRLMPTPRAGDGDKGGPNQRGSSGDMMLTSAVHSLLPTPRASAQENRTRGRTPSQDNGEHGRYLSAEVLTLFPTPTGTNANGNTENNRGEALLPGVAETLFPSPLATNSTGHRPLPAARTHDGPDHGPRLQDVAAALLPTATAQDAGASRSATANRAPGGTGKIGYTLTDRLAPPGQDRFPGWGPYAAAVARWEAITGAPAPVPVQPSAATMRRIRDCAAETGLDGYAARAAIEAGLWGAQLAPRFSEWLMGIPPGRVTGVPGLTRNEKLRLIGNGVVTVQAVAAVGVLAAELGWDR